ncbi:hypothetical protein ES703_47375 [subsurface metagenome]
MLRIEIDKDEPLFPGDVIEMQFKGYGPNWLYLRAAELAIIKFRLEQANPDYRLLNWQTPGDKLILTFRILEPREPTPQIQQAAIGTAAVIAVIVIGGGLFAWLSLDKIFKIFSSPAGQVALAGTGAVGIVAVVIVGYFVLSRYWGD